MTIFSPNNHVRHSHYLQPNCDAPPPSSFGRTGVFSLKKAPSSIFQKEKMPIKKKLSKSRFHQPRPMEEAQPQPPVDKIKTKTKPRKALADIFHWGNHSNAAKPIPSTKPITQPIKPAAPAVPPKDAAMALKKAHRPQSTNSHLSSMQPSVAPRPSMGDDPFGRDGQGAEVVEHVSRSPSVQSSVMNKRDSVASGRALSHKTVSEVSSIHATTEQAQRRVSAPIPAQPALIAPPPRSASLGRVLGATALPRVPELVAPEKTLNKEKTKSKVWDFLGRNKSKKREDISEPWVRPSVAPVPLSSLSAQMDDKYAAATLRSNVSIMRTRPPVLVSAPSNDLPAPPHSASSIASFSIIDGVSRFPGHGVWESVVGSAAERPSDDGQRQAIEALMGPSRLPKRKSLTGLFGVVVKKSMDRIKPSSPPRATRGTPAVSTLRSLAEETEDKPKPASQEDLFARHFGPLAVPQAQGVLRSDAGLRRVASATDKLLNLVAIADFSPAITNSPGVAARASSNSLRQAFNGSPTPIRKIKSAMLSNKSSSPLKPSSNVSPLKLALHRAQVAAHIPHKKAPAPLPSAPRQSMVRKGMRNIFAPPSPVPSKPGKPAASPTKLSAAAVIDEHVGTGATMGPTVVRERSIRGNGASDVPADLQAIISNANAAPADTARLGLPPLPPQDRVSPRRPAAAPPALSLPPLPDSEPLDHLFTPESRDDLTNLSLPRNDFRDSFDFTNEYAALDQGAQRNSFVEALRRVGSAQMLMDVAVPLLTEVPSFHVSKPSDSTSVDDESEDEDGDEELEDTAVIHHVVVARTSPVRREPFKGQAAFQQHASSIRQVSHASFGAPEPVAPDHLPVQPRRKGHRRGESSIATMSSIGSVIGTGNEREYTNYFEVNFAASLAQAHSRQPSGAIEEVVEDSLRRSASRESVRKAHHRRNSSIQSIDSMGEVNFFGACPPISMRNNRRSSYISRHRRNGSASSSFGRPDWAAHRRNTSTASTSSSISVSRIARPGLGDRMFQRDGGVALTSITGSPPDERPSHSRNASWDSLFDNTGKINDSLFDRSRPEDSLFDQSGGNDSLFSNGRISSDADSLFGPEHSSAKKDFFLRGLRPISTVSTAASSEQDDTFSHVSRFARSSVDDEQCLQGEGDDMSNMTPLGKAKVQPTGRQILGSSMSRPAKPNRRRPPQLVFAEPPLDTPGLTSPSASETSSRLSLDTNAASFTLGVRTRPRGAGHQRQKSSAGVKVDFTIPEMPSMATLRAANSSPADSREPTIVGVDVLRNEHSPLDEDDDTDKMQTVRKWVQWEREAMDEFRKIRHDWVDSEESKHALEEFRMPQTTQEIAAFLAQSSQTYRPLNQLPAARSAQPHRRISSLGDSRAITSPYGLPLPKSDPVNKPKMSLTTKFGKMSSGASSTTSSIFAIACPSFPDDVPEAPQAPRTAPLANVPPMSAVFAQFARETPPSPPPTFKPDLPLNFGLPTFDSFGLRKLETEASEAEKAKEEKRARVNSGARRQALGWGRRRNSDGPEQTIGIQGRREEVPRLPLAKKALLKPAGTMAGTSKTAAGAKGREKGMVLRDKDITKKENRSVATTARSWGYQLIMFGKQ